MEEQSKYETIATYMSFQKDIVKGKMMSSPGLKYNNKVFAFYSNKKMGFRLGNTFDPDAFGLKEVNPLSPFKTKPPLKGWFMVGPSEMDRWEELTELALNFTKTL